MALYDWVRNDGFINSSPGTLSSGIHREEEFIMLVRDIQYQDIKSGGYTKFPRLYDVALSNPGRNYINVTDNTKAAQPILDPPNPNALRKKN